MNNNLQAKTAQDFYQFGLSYLNTCLRCNSPLTPESYDCEKCNTTYFVDFVDADPWSAYYLVSITFRVGIYDVVYSSEDERGDGNHIFKSLCIYNCDDKLCLNTTTFIPPAKLLTQDNILKYLLLH